MSGVWPFLGGSAAASLFVVAWGLGEVVQQLKRLNVTLEIVQRRGFTE